MTSENTWGGLLLLLLPSVYWALVLSESRTGRHPFAPLPDEEEYESNDYRKVMQPGEDHHAMSGKSSGVFSKKIVANKRTFYMDIRETRDRTPYLVISALQRNSAGEPDNVHIYIFPDQLHAFHAGFEEAVSAMIERLPPQK